MKTAVLLLNLGGPDSLQAVEPFLANLFGDRDIFKLPFQKKLAAFIARKRAPKVIKEYELIGGRSPLGDWTELQRKSLEEKLRRIDPDTDVITCMRYWHPMTDEAVGRTINGGYDRIILLPLYPHFSVSTTGSSFNEWRRQMTALGAVRRDQYDHTGKRWWSEKWVTSSGAELEAVFINDYYDNPLYTAAINKRIDEGLEKFDDPSKVHILFSPHGTPLSYVKKGDPYSFHIKKTVEQIMDQRKQSHGYSLSYQSRVGPVKWLEPYTSDMIRRLSSEGRRQLLVIPVSFVSDHVETLYELDIEYRHIAEQAGIEKYIVMTGLNDLPEFTDALSDVVAGTVLGGAAKT